MTELRWILLAIGIALVTALAWWEWRRPRNLADKPDDPRVEPMTRVRDESFDPEPPLMLPEIRPPARDADLPILEVSAEELPELHVDPRGEPRDEAQAEARTIPTAAPAPPPDLAGEPIVDWPPEGERRIVSLRLVAQANERFAGRNLRQALAAAGFVNGKLSIFHRPGPDGRALVSAASLTRPGTFDPELMDSQRFTGLNLFSVLPGPLPASEAFDELLASARNLNERLAGELQDASGAPLTQSRVAALRDELSA
jgi:cell division protein ZipA